MTESKITASHLRRTAVIYVRQSSVTQVDRNKESTARQYDLVARAHALGWPSSAVSVIDDDLGVSGSSAAGRSGFAELVTRVGLGQVGIVLALECSRLARNNADWYRLLDLAGMTDTLIADADGVYHPGLFNDRLLLGMKGTMSEAELHILRARLDGGIRNKAARGELRIGLPIGLVWGEADGQILKHPDEAVRGVIAAIFEQFAARGSVRAVWLWLRDQGLKLPLIRSGYVAAADGIVWVDPTYHAVHNILTHPAYARRLHLRAHRPTPIRRPGRDTANTAKGAAPQRVGGLHHRPPRGIHRLGHLPGQPGPDRRQHPSRSPPTRHRRAAGGLRPAARAGHLRDLRPQTVRLLRRRTQSHARLLLHRHRPTRRRPRHPAPAGRRRRRSTPPSPPCS